MRFFAAAMARRAKERDPTRERVDKASRSAPESARLIYPYRSAVIAVEVIAAEDDFERAVQVCSPSLSSWAAIRRLEGAQGSGPGGRWFESTRQDNCIFNNLHIKSFRKSGRSNHGYSRRSAFARTRI